MNVHFVLPGESRLASLEALDPDRDWDQFITGERAWVLQTYLRLRAAGVPVQLVDRLPHEGIAIFSSKHRRRLLALQRGLRTSALLVSIREDVKRTPFADIDVVQNPSQVREGRALLMPFWPQPGLIARDVDRGDTIANVAYKGFMGNLHASFHAPQWLECLQRRGLTWITDAVQYAGATSRHEGIAWNDFSTTDLIVAVRPEERHGHPHKPATKLYNAWHAGAPALLGPELAYRGLRCDPLDYIEVRDSTEATAAIDILLADRRRYRAMIEHGRERAREFTVAAITARWHQLVTVTLPQLAAARHRHGRTQPLWLRQLLGRIAHATSLRND